MVSFSSTHNRHIPVMLMETIDNLKNRDIARVFWDADQYYYNNSIFQNSYG